MTIPIGIATQPLTIDPVAPPHAEPTPPVVNHRAHAAPNAKPIAAAAELLRNAAKKFEAHLSSIDPAPYTGEGLHKQIAAFNDSPAAQQIDAAVEIAAQREADAEAHVADVMRSLSPEGDTAAELRATRAWNRARLRLDAADGTKVSEVARTLIANANDSELGVLLQELPSFLASKGQDSTDWLEAVVASKVPALADAQRKLKLARQARPQVEFDAKRLRDRITNTASPHAYSPVAFLDLGKYDPDGA